MEFGLGSLALVSDFAHVLLDVFALGISFLLCAFLQDQRMNVIHMVFIVLKFLLRWLMVLHWWLLPLVIFYESYKRFFTLVEIKSGYMLIIAVIGLLVNLYVAFILRKEDHAGHDHGTKDINVQSAYLHVIGDAISSIGVIIAAYCHFVYKLEWLDPVVSIIDWL